MLRKLVQLNLIQLILTQMDMTEHVGVQQLLIRVIVNLDYVIILVILVI